MKSKDLGGIPGDKTKASPILNRRRKLGLEMIRPIHNHLHIPAEILMRDYELPESTGQVFYREFSSFRIHPNLCL